MDKQKTRRQFLHEGGKLAAAVALGSALGSRAQAAKVRGFEEYRQYDAMGLAELVRDVERLMWARALGASP